MTITSPFALPFTASCCVFTDSPVQMGFTLDLGLFVKVFEVWPFEERVGVGGKTGVEVWSTCGLVVYECHPWELLT